MSNELLDYADEVDHWNGELKRIEDEIKKSAEARQAAMNKIGEFVKVDWPCDSSWPKGWHNSEMMEVGFMGIIGQRGIIINITDTSVGASIFDPMYIIRLVEGRVVDLWEEEFEITGELKCQ